MPRFVRFLHDGAPRYGVVDEGEVHPVDPHPFAAHRRTGERVPLEGLRLLAPVIPSKIVCIGWNYADQQPPASLEATDQPVLFLKPSTAVVGPGDPILLPTDYSTDVRHGAELAVVVGALLQRVTPDEAMTGVFGYTCANDVTAHDRLRSESQWFRAKAFDSSCPLGPVISNDVDPGDLRIRCVVDGEPRQDGSTSQMVVGVGELLSRISEVVTLLPSDVVLTGSPAGAGTLVAGQTVRVEIDGLGVLENPVVDRPRPPDAPGPVIRANGAGR